MWVKVRASWYLLCNKFPSFSQAFMSSFMATKLNIANESDGGVKIRLFVDDSSRAIIKTCEKVTKHKLTKAQG